MYNFIFWFCYRARERGRGEKSTFSSAMIVALTIMIHVGLVYATIRYFTGYNVGTFSNDYFTNKLMLAPFIILLFVVVYLFYYFRGVENVLKKFDGRKLFTLANIALMVLIIVVPLVIAAMVTNLAVAKYNH